MIEALEIYRESIRNIAKCTPLQETSIEQEIIDVEREIVGLFASEIYHESKYYMD